MSKKVLKPYELTQKLTKKQILWIDEFIKTDDNTKATINAGYNTKYPRLIGYENSIKLSKFIQQRNKKFEKELTKNTIAELTDIFEFWTTIINSEDTRLQDRIKASELLAKAKGGFIEKVEVKKVDTDWFVDEDDNS